jgi:hypothetical protein
MKKDIGLLNRIAKLEARQATRKGSWRAVDPAAHERLRALRSKMHSIMPGSPWTPEREREYQEHLSRLPPLPPLTDADKRFMASPHFRTSSIEELMSALRARMAGMVPTRFGHQIPPEPILNPSPPRTAERAEVEEHPDIPQPTPVRRENGIDKLEGYRDQGGLPYFEND